MTNLYDLSKSVEQVIMEVIDAEGELSELLENRLEEVSLDFKSKSSNIGKWVLNIDANAEAIDTEIARLMKRAQVQQNLKKRLKDYLKFCMENAGLRKLDLGTFTISIAKNPPSVEVENEAALPGKFIRIVQTQSVDKKLLLSALKSGEQVEGARLITDREHLSIK